jgi:hypothetical protein
MRIVLAAPLLLLLASCGQQERAPEAPVETPIPVEPDGGIGDGAGPPEAVSGETIPARFHGVWDAEGGSCDPASELRVEIGPDRIEFYESVGEVTAVTEEDGRVLADLALEGEGETWANSLALSLDGERLSIDDPDAPGGSSGAPVRVRCPG